MPIARRTSSFRRAGAALALALALAGLTLGVAGAEEREQDAVRRAVESGEIRPLADILAAIRDKLPGEVVGVDAERKHGRWLYEFRVVDSQGRLFEVYVDAKNATIERSKEK